MERINALQRELSERRPLTWEQLPDFSLYIDQVLSCVGRQTIALDATDELTAAMVNNYCKSGLLPRAEGKRYSREHLAHLTTIMVLKQVLSTRELELLFTQQLKDRPVQERYAAFSQSLGEALERAAAEMDGYLEPERVADGAAHFALLSYAFGLACRQYLHLLEEGRGSEPSQQGKKGRENT